MNVPKMLRSFKFAFQGIQNLVKSENNARFHLLVTIIIIPIGVFLGLASIEWAIILTQIGLVWAAEAFNTAIEKLCDYVSPQHQVLIGKVKDLAAAGVLFVTIVAITVGLIIFGSKFIAL